MMVDWTDVISTDWSNAGMGLYFGGMILSAIDSGMGWAGLLFGALSRRAVALFVASEVCYMYSLVAEHASLIDIGHESTWLVMWGLFFLHGIRRNDNP